MLLFPSSFDVILGTLLTTTQKTIDAYVTAFNLFDPFKLVRASHRLQQDLLAVALRQELSI